MNLKLSRKWEIILILAIAVFAFCFSIATLQVRPAFWFDEGITIEIARNFALFGKLDVLTAPHMFSGVPYLVGTNGYPLTIPLGLFFKAFGAGLLQARIFMLFWLSAVGIVLYAVTRRVFGVPAALSALALAATFASLYGNGLTATGEMPGLFFFILGLWFLVGKRMYFWTGISWGLAMASKPGVFLLLAHTLIFYTIFIEGRRFFPKLVSAGIGFALPIGVWIALAFPLTLGTFYSIVAYALNPIDIPVVTSFLHNLPAQTLNEGLIIPATKAAATNVQDNLRSFFTSSTLLYFSLLGLLAATGLFLARKRDENFRRAFYLLMTYGILTLFFFVRGPGWFRYLIGLQVLIFIVLPAALESVAIRLRPYLSRLRISQDGAVVAGICVLVLFQISQLFLFSNLPSSPKMLEALEDIQARMADDPRITIGIYNIPEIAALTDPERTYHISLPQEGMSPLGYSPLLLEDAPGLIVLSKQHTLAGPEEETILSASYRKIDDFPKFDLYERIAQ